MISPTNPFRAAALTPSDAASSTPPGEAPAAVDGEKSTPNKTSMQVSCSTSYLVEWWTPRVAMAYPTPSKLTDVTTAVLEKAMQPFQVDSIISRPNVLTLTRDMDAGALNTGLVEFTRLARLPREEVTALNTAAGDSWRLLPWEAVTAYHAKLPGQHTIQSFFAVSKGACVSELGLELCE